MKIVFLCIKFSRMTIPNPTTLRSKYFRDYSLMTSCYNHGILKWFNTSAKCCCDPKNYIYYCKNISHKTVRYEKSLAAKGIKISDTIKPQSLKIPSLKCVSKKRTEQVDDKKRYTLPQPRKAKYTLPPCPVIMSVNWRRTNLIYRKTMSAG